MNLHPTPTPFGVPLTRKRARQRSEPRRREPVPSPVVEILDTREVALRLHVDESTVLRCCRKGLPHRRVGKANRYVWASVVRWLEGADL